MLAIQEAEKRMRERVEQLRGELRHRVFEAAGEAMSVADTVALVDTLERLGVDSHFREEIGAALRRVVNSGPGSCKDSDLHVVALRFRLLRQHGYWVPTGACVCRTRGNSESLAMVPEPDGLVVTFCLLPLKHKCHLR